MEQDDISKDRRLFSRIPFNGHVTLINDEGQWACNLVDISLKGVLIDQPADWTGKLGQSFQLEISLSEGKINILMDVTTSHIRDQRIGFCCTHIDLESITHLRRLLELNIGDEEQMNRELSALIYNICSLGSNGR